VSFLVRRSSTAIYSVTKGPRDEPGGEHRTFWHTAVGAGVLGLGAGFGTGVGGRWAVIAVLVFGVLLAAAALGDLVLVAIVLVAGLWVAHTGFALAALAPLDAASGWLGYAVVIGCLTHDLGDALTEHGCPILFPCPIAGETYYELRPPAWLRFRTGGPAEHVLVFALFTPLSILLIPGAWPIAWPLIHSVISAVLPG
jgi:hypothetical protein